MIFGKKRGMIDVRELQRKGVVKIPEKEIIIPTDKSGFVDLSSKRNSTIMKPSSTSSNSDFFGFTGNSLDIKNEESISGDGYSKREVDEKVTNLDNKIYKLEQRIELLEKKIGINNSRDDSSLIKW